MTHHIVIILGYPDATKHHHGHALAEAYAEGARQAGHEIKTIAIAELDFPFIHRYEEFYEQEPLVLLKNARRSSAGLVTLC